MPFLFFCFVLRMCLPLELPRLFWQPIYVTKWASQGLAMTSSSPIHPCIIMTIFAWLQWIDRQCTMCPQKQNFFKNWSRKESWKTSVVESIVTSAAEQAKMETELPEWILCVWRRVLLSTQNPLSVCMNNLLLFHKWKFHFGNWSSFIKHVYAFPNLKRTTALLGNWAKESQKTLGTTFVQRSLSIAMHHHQVLFRSESGWFQCNKWIKIILQQI